MAYAPFSGGMRVCFGKTFAEQNLLTISIFLTQTFDFDLKDKENYPGHELPVAMFAQGKTIPIMMTLKERTVV